MANENPIVLGATTAKRWMASREIDPTVIYLGGKITGKPPHHICRLGISRTFQLVKTFPSMTAFENVLVRAIYGYGMKGKEARAA